MVKYSDKDAISENRIAKHLTGVSELSPYNDRRGSDHLQDKENTS